MVTRILIAVVLIAAGAKAAAVGGDPCRRGPIYWCSSVEVAASCNAFTHCLQTVWEPQLIDVQQTETCLSSQELIENARRERSVDGKIFLPLVTSLCNSAQDEETKGRCQETVTNFLPQIADLLESKMESSSLSTLLGLCRLYDEEPEIDLTPEYKEETHSFSCSDYNDFFHEARKLLRTPGAENEVTTTFESVCSKFGDLEIWCKAVVDEGLPKLLKYIEENDGADKLESFATVCDGDDSPKLKDHYWTDIVKTLLSDIEVDTDVDVICHDCDKVLTSFLDFAKDSPIRTSFEHAIAHLCSYTSLGEWKCRQISEYFNRIPYFLHSAAARVDVPYVCKSVVGCTGGEEEEHKEHREQSNSAQAPAEDTRSPVMPPVSVSENHAAPASEPDRCMECELMLGDVSRALQTERSVVQATTQLKHIVCHQLEGLEDQCFTMVDVFAPVLVDWLNKAYGPRFVCSQLNVCPVSADMKSLDLVKLFGDIWHKDRLTEVAGIECEACYALMKEIIAADRNPDVQNAVVDFANGLCDELGQEAAQCKALVAQYAPELFEIIANELDPTTVCELLMSCTKPGQGLAEQEEEEEEADSHTEPEEVVIGQPSMPSEEHKHLVKKAKATKQRGNDLECSMCQAVLEALDKEIGANTTEEKLNQILGEVCGILPAEDKDACQQMIDTFAPAIIHLLLQELDPLMVCQELGLCKKAPQPTQPAMAYPAPEKKEDLMEEGDRAEETIRCELCELVVGYLDNILAENRTEAAVQKGLEEVCGVVPKNIHSQCLSLVDQYSSVLVELLMQELQPQQVCIFINLCKKEHVEKEDKLVKISLPETHSEQDPSDANTSQNKETSTGEVCLVCQTLTNYLKEALNEESTMDEVEKLLEGVCNVLPDTDNLKATCNMIVEQFTPMIFQLLKDKTDPKEICEALKLCSPEAELYEAEEPVDEAPEDEHLLGTDKCNYGPDYWCASMENARECGMEEECVMKYGMQP